MSDKTEMITITYEVSLDYANRVTKDDFKKDYEYFDIKAERRAIKAALDARKSLYERYKDNTALPWVVQGVSVFDGYMEDIFIDGNTSVDDRRLIAAAPEMLDALIAGYPSINKLSPPGISVIKAIRAALPGDVADEVLGT